MISVALGDFGVRESQLIFLILDRRPVGPGGGRVSLIFVLGWGVDKGLRFKVELDFAFLYQVNDVRYVFIFPSPCWLQ